MYDELVKELRHIDEFATEINRPTSGIFREAADVIEDLSRENAPQSPSEPFSEEYAYACKYIDAAAYELDRATEKLREFERGKQ